MQFIQYHKGNNSLKSSLNTVMVQQYFNVLHQHSWAAIKAKQKWGLSCTSGIQMLDKDCGHWKEPHPNKPEKKYPKKKVWEMDTGTLRSQTKDNDIHRSHNTSSCDTMTKPQSSGLESRFSIHQEEVEQEFCNITFKTSRAQKDAWSAVSTPKSSTPLQLWSRLLCYWER